MRVIVDFTQTSGPHDGVQVKKLIAAGVPVLVHTLSIFMTHDKYIVVDNRVAIEGSVNWTEYAMVSAGRLVIIDDRRVVAPMAQGFAELL